MTDELKQQAKNNILFEKELREQYEKDRQQRIETTLFPSKEVDQVWFAQAKRNLGLLPILTIGLPVAEFEKVSLAMNPKKLTLGEMAALCNIFQMVSADQMNIQLSQYVKLQRINSKLVDIWHSKIKEIDDELLQVVEGKLIAYHQEKTGQNTAPLMMKVAEA